MRKLTIAELRERELNFAVREYGLTYEKGKHLMNRFYRLNADLDRLSYLDNDSRKYNSFYTKQLQESTDRRSIKLNKDLEKYNLCLKYFGHELQ